VITLAHQPLDLRAYRFSSAGKLLPPSIQTSGSAALDYDSPMVFFAYKDDEARPSADVYALGAAMYMLLTGTHPPEDPAQRPPLRQLNPALAEETEMVVNKAMHPDQNQRFPDGAAMAAVLYKLRNILKERRRKAAQRKPKEGLPAWAPFGFLLLILAFLVLAVAGGLATGALAPFLPDVPTPTPSPTSPPATVVIAVNATSTATPTIAVPTQPVGDASLIVNQVNESSQGNRGSGNSLTPVPATPEGSATETSLTDAMPDAQTPQPSEGTPSSLDDLAGAETPAPNNAGQQVTAYVSILDPNGEPLTGVAPTQFAVYRDGQLLSNCSIAPLQEFYEPISAVIAIDISGSMEGKPLEKAKEAAIQYVQHSHPEDRLALLQFDDRIEWLTDFTTDHQQLIRLIQGLQPRGDTALNDTVYEAAAKLQTQEGRRALLILTDGRDTASKAHSLNDAVAVLQANSIPVFAIGLNSKQFTDKPLRLLAEETNGRYLYAPTPDELLAIYERIGTQLKNQYRVSCMVPSASTAGTHELRVVVSDGQHVIEGRKQYIVRTR